MARKGDDCTCDSLKFTYVWVCETKQIFSIGGGKEFCFGGLTCIAISYQAHSSKRVNCGTHTEYLGGGLQPQSPMGSSVYV